MGAWRQCAVALALLLAPVTAGAAPENYTLDPEHTYAYFSVLHTGVSTLRGRVAIEKGGARLDAGASFATVDVTMDMASISTGSRKLDDLLRSEDFFDSGAYPTARFAGRATRFENGVPRQFEGVLSLRGRTLPVILEAERFACREVLILVVRRHVCGGDLAATLRRSELGLDRYLDLVSDEVRLTVSVEAIRDPSP